jgi:BTB/POZ domain
MGRDMAMLLESAAASDVTFEVEDEEMRVHRIILQARRRTGRQAVRQAMAGADAAHIYLSIRPSVRPLPHPRTH